MVRAAKVRDDDGQTIRGYYCDECCETFRSDSEETYLTLWRIDQSDSFEAGSWVYSEESPREVTAWKCEDGCLHPEESEPEFGDLYRCDSCEAIHVNADNAAECCD